ncbi:MAG: pantoate--beta-alanine ligase [Actinobaculum massiliense]|nr:pantoate--beta-alanine ligase [Actinobaculum massiliense]MDK8319427.1 pantoate--beta-alanine ligase [Actinobaculum massiliense]MDK8566606.1 pantoate--beta-alanine ligase [Actinobaculum massiliense]
MAGVAQLIRTKKELREQRADMHGSVGLVMTMGALHQGHLQLVRAARESSENVIVSIYVNPLQFAPNEDFDAYPRDLEADMALLETVLAEGDVVFAPSDEEMYPREPLVRINPGLIATLFEGTTRPTHFAGVLQVVNKVFNLARPDVAFFGQKDAQQLSLIRTMVTDLDMPLEIRAVPIVREESGLARSSRNSYLSENERIQAQALSQALSVGRDAAARGAGPEQTLRVAREYLDAADGVRVDYLELVDPETFQSLAGADGVAAPAAGLLIVAAYVGPTRLIDNMEVVFRER